MISTLYVLPNSNSINIHCHNPAGAEKLMKIRSSGEGRVVAVCCCDVFVCFVCMYARMDVCVSEGGECGQYGISEKEVEMGRKEKRIEI